MRLPKHPKHCPRPEPAPPPAQGCPFTGQSSSPKADGVKPQKMTPRTRNKDKPGEGFPPPTALASTDPTLGATWPLLATAPYDGPTQPSGPVMTATPDPREKNVKHQKTKKRCDPNKRKHKHKRSRRDAGREGGGPRQLPPPPFFWAQWGHDRANTQTKQTKQTNPGLCPSYGTSHRPGRGNPWAKSGPVEWERGEFRGGTLGPRKRIYPDLGRGPSAGPGLDPALHKEKDIRTKRPPVA